MSNVEEVISWVRTELPDTIEKMRLRRFTENNSSVTVWTKPYEEFDEEGLLDNLEPGRYILQALGERGKAIKSKRFNVTSVGYVGPGSAQLSLDAHFSRMFGSANKAQSDIMKTASNIMTSVFKTAVQGINETNRAMPKAMNAMSTAVLSMSNMSNEYAKELERVRGELAEEKAKKNAPIIPEEFVQLATAYMSKSDKNLDGVINLLNEVPIKLLKTGMVKIRTSLSKERLAVVRQALGIKNTKTNQTKETKEVNYQNIGESREHRLAKVVELVKAAIDDDPAWVMDAFSEDIAPYAMQKLNEMEKEQEDA